MKSIATEGARSWREQVAPADRTIEGVLRQEPSRVYLQCDALTAESYHRAVVQIATWASVPATEVARAAVALAAAAPRGSAAAHVGYYLIEQGRSELERVVQARVPKSAQLHRALRRHAVSVYFAIILSVVAALLVTLYGIVEPHVSVTAACIWIALLTVPVLRAGAAVAQVALHPWFAPRRLPRLQVPVDSPLAARTAVILPVIIGSESDIDEAVDTLERNFLNAQQREMPFLLLTDLSDAPQQELPRDRYLLEKVDEHLRQLNARHDRCDGRRRFQHLHRPRVFNAREQAWMGWERKRGKIVELCRLIAGDRTTSFGAGGTLDFDLSRLEYLITLDADSILEPGGAATLIGVMAHPLNAPRWRGDRMVAGYGIVRPRMAPAREQTSGAFFKAMYGSDRRAPPQRELQPSFYQDVFGTDMFFGKGILSVRACLARIEARIPENVVLSHDHLEGILARVGFSSDVLLFEDFPSDALAWRRRQHRWVRGDTQAAIWMLPWVPSGGGAWVRSELSVLDRWKLAKNLISHTSAPFLLIVAVAAWLGMFGPRGGVIGVAALAAIAAWPVIACVSTLLNPVLPRHLDGSVWQMNRIVMAARILKQGAVNWVWIVVMLLDTSLIVVDAMSRSLYRLAVSRRGLLQWSTAAAVRRAGLNRSARQAWAEMKGAPVAAAGIGAAVALLEPQNIAWALPFVLAWFCSPQVAFMVKGKSEKE